MRDQLSITAEAGGGILHAFEGLLEQMVQSKTDITGDSLLELVAQVVKNPRGSGKHKIEKTLESIQKKKHQLYVVQNTNDQLCFAINLVHLMDPKITDSQALEQGKVMQRLAGLSDQTAGTLSDISKFKAIVKCKIVVFCRHSADRALSTFHISFLNCRKPLFLFLF